MQRKQQEWAWQWKEFQDDNLWLFTEWIAPNTLEDFRGKDVLDCGCGGGQHTAFVTPYARSVTGVDLNALGSAREHTKDLQNVTLIEADLAEMDLGRQFDIVFCIGVIHHTDDPDKTFRNIAKHCKSGGKVIVWAYSHEGNFWNRTLLESMKRMILLKLPRGANVLLAHILTTLLYPIIYTVYLFTPRSLGEVGLPFYQYFENWRRLSYTRNLLNVFDKLNAPQTIFITKERIGQWFNPTDFTDVHISPYKGVSWRGSATVIPHSRA